MRAKYVKEIKKHFQKDVLRYSPLKSKIKFQNIYFIPPLKHRKKGTINSLKVVILFKIKKIKKYLFYG